MTIPALRAAACILLAFAPCGAGVVVGQKLPEVAVADKGVMVPHTRVENARMVLDGRDLTYRPWALQESAGRVRTIYHLAGRLGIENLNKPFIDAIIAAQLPEFLPDSPYKTITVLNLADAAWGVHGIAMGKFETSQREHAHAVYVADEKGAARAAWGLEPKQSAVILLDRDGTVLFFKEGKLSPEEIAQAMGILKDKLK